MSSRENLNSSGKSSLVVLKWDQKLNFAFYDIRRVFTDRITNIKKKKKKKKKPSTFINDIVLAKYYSKHRYAQYYYRNFFNIDIK